MWSSQMVGKTACAPLWRFFSNYFKNSKPKLNILKYIAVYNLTKTSVMVPLSGRSNLTGQSLYMKLFPKYFFMDKRSKREKNKKYLSHNTELIY